MRPSPVQHTRLTPRIIISRILSRAVKVIGVSRDATLADSTYPGNRRIKGCDPRRLVLPGYQGNRRIKVCDPRRFNLPASHLELPYLRSTAHMSYSQHYNKCTPTSTCHTHSITTNAHPHQHVILTALQQMHTPYQSHDIKSVQDGICKDLSRQVRRKTGKI